MDARHRYGGVVPTAMPMMRPSRASACQPGRRRTEHDVIARWGLGDRDVQPEFGDASGQFGVDLGQWLTWRWRMVVS